MSLQKRESSSSDQAYFCVFCNKTLLRGRLLSCLHNICLSCVREELGGLNDILCPRCGTVTKAPTSGAAQILALPNSYNLQRQTTAVILDESGKPTTLCDECVDEEEAVKICAGCGMRYCSVHAAGHKKSKATSSHTLYDIDDELSTTDGRVVECSACPLHGSNRLELFCEACGELFCKRCKQQGVHRGHESSITQASQAARKLREQLRTLRNPTHQVSTEDTTRLSSPTDNSNHGELSEERQQLQSCLETMTCSIASLNKRTEIVSAEINSAFGRAIDATKRRQQSLIVSLDKNRWAKQKVLEEQQQQLERSLEASEQIDVLLEGCHNDLDFLRMSTWLGSMHEEIASCMLKNAVPATASHMVFERRNMTEVEVLAAKAGGTRDAAADVEHSAVTCTHALLRGQDLDITIAAVDSDGAPVSAAVASEMDFSVSLKPEEGEAVPCEVTAGSSVDEIKAFLKDPTPGTYRLSVTMGYRHLKGSPMEIKVSDAAPQFDPDQHGPYVALSNNNCTAQLSSMSYNTLFSSAKASCGSLEFTVRLDTFHTSYDRISLLVSSQDPRPSLNDSVDPYITDAYGWILQSQGSGYGGGLSPAVQQGDVIAVALDCDRSTVTFTLQRTGQMQILRNLCAGNYYLYINMYGGGSGHYPQVTLM